LYPSMRVCKAVHSEKSGIEPTQACFTLSWIDVHIKISILGNFWIFGFWGISRRIDVWTSKFGFLDFLNFDFGAILAGLMCAHQSQDLPVSLL
jgi:hypothetical protein